MLHPLSPGGSGDTRPTKSVVGRRSRSLVLSSRDAASAVAPPPIATAAKAPVANSRSRTGSEPLHNRLHHPTSTTALPSPPSPPSPPPPPLTRGVVGFPGSSVQLPGASDTFTFSSIDSSSIASAESDTHPRIRRICSKPDAPLRRHNSAPRTLSPTVGLGDNYTERRPLGQTLRDRCGQETGDLADIRPITPKSRRTSTGEMPVSFADELRMPSSPPLPYGNSGRALGGGARSGPLQAAGRVPTIKELAKDPPVPLRASATMDMSTAEQGGGILSRQDMGNRVVGGSVSSKWWLERRGARRAPRRSDVNQGVDQHGKSPETVQQESARETGKPTERSVGSSSTARPPSAPIPNTTTWRGGEPERKPPSRLSGRAKNTKEEFDEGRSRQAGSSAGPERPSSASASTLDARPSTARESASSRVPIVSRSSKESTSPKSERKQPISAIASPGRVWPRRERQPITKPATSPESAPRLPPSEATVAITRREFVRDLSLRARDGRGVVQKPVTTKEQSLCATSTQTLESGTSVEGPKGFINNPGANGKAPTSEPKPDQADLSRDEGDISQKISGRALSSSPNSWSTFESNHSPKEPPSRGLSLEREDNPRRINAQKPSEPSLTRIGAHLQARTQGMSETPTPKATGNRSGLFSQSLLQSPEIGDYDELLAAPVSTTRGHSKRRTKSPSAKTARQKAPIPAVHRPRRSRLEDEDSDVDSLQYLIDNDRDFSALFCPSSDEEDTALLLSGGQPYRPVHKQTVRPRSEAQAGDEQCERERAVHEKLMNRLRTLQLEVRSTSRGIDVLEGFLGSSDDNSEFVNDEEAKAYMKMLRKERENRRLELELRRRQLTAGPRNPRVAWLVKWGIPALLVFLLWYAIELAVYLHSIPPSYSNVRVDLPPPHRFGSRFTNLTIRLLAPILDLTLLLVRGVLLGINSAWLMLANSGSFVSSIWRTTATTSSPFPSSTATGPGGMYASMSGGGSAPPLGSDQVIG